MAGERESRPADHGAASQLAKADTDDSGRIAFVDVATCEVKRYGVPAAIVLAHIRFRCESDGPGRVVHDGARWWQAAHRDIGREVGLSAKAVRTALNALGGAVAVRHLPGEPNWYRAEAYRAARGEPTADCVTR